MTRPAISRIADTLRPLGSLVVATARQVSTRRLVLTGAVTVALVAVALLVRLPTAVELRDWSTSMGPWFPLAFLAAHIVVTVLPFPRTAFTLAAGLLFGPVARGDAGGGRQHGQRGDRAGVGPGGRLAAQPVGSPSGCRDGRRPAARARMGCGPVAAADSRGAVRAAELRRRRVRRCGCCPTRWRPSWACCPGRRPW